MWWLINIEIGFLEWVVGNDLEARVWKTITKSWRTSIRYIRGFPIHSGFQTEMWTDGFDAPIPTDESAYARKLLLVQMLPMSLMSVDPGRQRTFEQALPSSPSRSISTSGCAAISTRSIADSTRAASGWGYWIKFSIFQVLSPAFVGEITWQTPLSSMDDTNADINQVGDGKAHFQLLNLQRRKWFCLKRTMRGSINFVQALYRYGYAHFSRARVETRKNMAL